MNKRSIKQAGETLATKELMIVGGESDKQKEEQQFLDRKIATVTEGFTTSRFCEFVLRDRNRLSKENALTICDYIIAMKREINPRHQSIQPLSMQGVLEQEND